MEHNLSRSVTPYFAHRLVIDTAADPLWLLAGSFCRSLFYSAILPSRANTLRSHVNLHEWTAFYSAFFEYLPKWCVYSTVWLLLHSLYSVLFGSVHWSERSMGRVSSPSSHQSSQSLPFTPRSDSVREHCTFTNTCSQWTCNSHTAHLSQSSRHFIGPNCYTCHSIIYNLLPPLLFFFSSFTSSTHYTGWHQYYHSFLKILDFFFFFNL